MNKTQLKNYARLIVRSGVNVQRGQEVVICADVESEPLVALITEEAYRAGAKKVVVDFTSQSVSRAYNKHTSLKVMSVTEAYEVARLQHYVDELPARIYIISEAPDAMRGLDQAKLSAARQARLKISKPYRDKIENKYQWCICAYAGRAWAKKVFPSLSAPAAQKKLFDAIYFCSRAEGDGLENWKRHTQNIKSRCEYLNGLRLDRLHYYGDNGTDLTVGLIRSGSFMGAEESTAFGVPFNANIPSEEIYSSPDRSRCDGIVYATKPLSYQGQIIKDFSLKFSGGRVVEVRAAENEKLLKSIVEMDEGAKSLGEVALLPVDSPIAQSGILFYETLFDENAACHLALGEGFTNTLVGYEKLSLDECRALGVNESLVHVDFMVGYEGLNIDGITCDGKTVSIIKNGRWAK